MSDDPKPSLFRILTSIELIAAELPHVGKRSELRVKAGQILDLANEARKRGKEMEDEIISLKYEYPAQRFERKKGVKRG